ncbi:MAG: FkbM family methyltransferase [Pseudomonadota bacterium]
MVKMWLKRVVNGVLARAGLRLLDLSAGIGFDTRHGVELLPVFARALAQEHNRRLRLIQIGANDGVNNDPVRALIDDGLVEAVLVEPIPALCADLRARHSGRDDVRVVEAAVVAEPSVLRLHILMAPDGRMLESSVSSLDRGFVERQLAEARRADASTFAEAHIEAIDVRCLTVSELLAETGCSEIDIVAIDVEGMDVHLVNALLDCALTPRLLQFEAAHVPRRAFGALAGRLEAAGYRLARSGLDILAVRESAAWPSALAAAE